MRLLSGIYRSKSPVAISEEFIRLANGVFDHRENFRALVRRGKSLLVRVNGSGGIEIGACRGFESLKNEARECKCACELLSNVSWEVGRLRYSKCAHFGHGLRARRPNQGRVIHNFNRRGPILDCAEFWKRCSNHLKRCADLSNRIVQVRSNQSAALDLSTLLSPLCSPRQMKRHEGCRKRSGSRYPRTLICRGERQPPMTKFPRPRITKWFQHQECASHA